MDVGITEILQVAEHGPLALIVYFLWRIDRRIFHLEIITKRLTESDDLKVTCKPSKPDQRKGINNG